MADSTKPYNFSFLFFRLTSVQFSLLKKEEDIVGKQIELSPELTASHQILGPKRCDVFLSVKLSGSEAPINFFIQGQGAFEFHEEIVADAHFEKIAQINLFAIVFPFIREAIAEISRRMGIAPLLLPPINFIAMHDAKTVKLQDVSNPTIKLAP